MLLFVLICCVDFIVGFRDDFSAIFQSWVVVVVVVREGVTVHNPKTDSKSEVECSRYGLKIWRGAREELESRVATWPARVGGRGPHAPPTGWWRGGSWFARKISPFPPFKPTSFPPHLCNFLKNTWSFSHQFFYNFCLLVLIISLSYELEIIRFKNQNCWSRRELQTPSISRGSWLRHFSQ